MDPGRTDPSPGGRDRVPSLLAADPGAGAKVSPRASLAAALGVILLVGAGDYVTGTDVALVLFYLAPVGLGTWYAGVPGGVLLSVATSVVAFGSDALHRVHAGQGTLPTAILAWNAGIQLGTSLGLVLVLGALRSRLLGEELLARTDALTQIPNRRAFIEAAMLELERARRHARPIAVAYVDCDDFKDVNDVLGHAQGDALLVTAAQTLRGETRAVDAVARLGGDEFGLLLPETTPAEAEALLTRLRATLLAAMTRHGWKVGFSIGAAVFQQAPASVDEMMARADELMYAAKREAKGSIRLGVFGAGREGLRAVGPA